MSTHNGALPAVAKFFGAGAAYFGAWFANWNLADIELLTRIVGGWIIAVVGLLNAWVLIRKLMRGEPERP